MEEKYGLLFCSWEQSSTGKSYMSNFFVFFFCHIFRTTLCWDPDILLSSCDVTTCPLYKALCQLKQIFFTFEFFRAMLSKVHLFACGMHLSISLIYIRWPCLHTPSPWPRIPLPPVYSRRFKAKPSLKVSVVHESYLSCRFAHREWQIEWHFDFWVNKWHISNSCQALSTYVTDSGSWKINPKLFELVAC